MLSEENAKKWKRTFQPREKTQQEEMWYSAIPIDIMWGIYARQSKLAQLVEHFESTEMQTEDLIQLLVKKGVRDGNWQLFDADLGVSGTLPIDKRTGLQELVEQIKADIIKAVLVYQISRLFRDDTGVEYNTFAKICKEHNCILMTADGMVFNFNNRMHLKMFRFLAGYAAEYIPQQLGLLHAARMRKARRGLYVACGPIPCGYIVDYNKESETYKKFILYTPFQDPILNLFERFYALEANLTALCREVEEMPYVFPRYEAWVDKRSIRDRKWKKVPKGYHISRRGIISILTNPVYIGWMIVAGDIVSTHNHDRLIPLDKEYLFWFAFDHLAEFTIKGEVNSKRSLPPRRFFHRHCADEAGLLKDRIEAPEGNPVYVHLTGGRTPCYRMVKRGTKIYDKNKSEIEIDLVDREFTKLLFTHLRQTDEFDGFRQWITDMLQKRKTQIEIVMAQLEEIAVQQEAILDEKLAIRTHINQQVKAALAEDEAADVEALKVKFEQEVKQDIERLRIRSHKLDEREKELRSKLPTGEDEEEVKVARTFADFQTELEKLANVWEKEALRTQYASAPREVLLQLLPHKSWAAIHEQAFRMSLHRPQQLPRQRLGIDRLITWLDYEFCQSIGVSSDTRETICLAEASNTGMNPSPGL